MASRDRQPVRGTASADQPAAVPPLLELDPGPQGDPERQPRRWSRGDPEPVHRGVHGLWGSTSAPIGEPWLSAGYYVPGATPHRDATGNPADPPRLVNRFVAGSPASVTQDQAIVAAGNYVTMRNLLESVHNAMHGFVAMGGAHISFRDPFVFPLHSNVDRLFALWQLQPISPQRLDPNFIYGPESGDPALNGNVEPWSTGHSFDQFGIEHFTRPWFAPENEGVPKTYKHPLDRRAATLRHQPHREPASGGGQQCGAAWHTIRFMVWQPFGGGRVGAEGSGRGAEQGGPTTPAQPSGWGSRRWVPGCIWRRSTAGRLWTHPLCRWLLAALR